MQGGERIFWRCCGWRNKYKRKQDGSKVFELNQTEQMEDTSSEIKKWMGEDGRRQVSSEPTESRLGEVCSCLRGGVRWHHFPHACPFYPQ